MSLQAKLQLKGPVRAINVPDDVDLGDVSVSDDAPGAIGFAVHVADLGALGQVYEAAARDDAAWVAYPKAKQRGTDRNRDLLHTGMQAHGLRTVRQISIGGVWSAMRLRPA